MIAYFFERGSGGCGGFFSDLNRNGFSDPLLRVSKRILCTAEDFYKSGIVADVVPFGGDFYSEQTCIAGIECFV
jgi:hypothetical protein